MTQEPFIPFAVWYTGGRARATMVRPPEPDSPVEWKKDLQRIRDCGFNSVRCWVDWATAEPRPAEYHFETLDLLMDLAEEVGLRVIIQIYLDSAPDWLVERFPDCRYISAGGTPVDSQGAPGYCYDNPGVHQAAESFMTRLAAQVASRPNFYAWDLWSEPHIVQWGYFDFLPQPPVFCYCHHTVSRFRQWLQRKYTDLQSLNKAWYRQFSSWELIPAPRFISLMTYTEYIDWIHFIQDKLAEDLSWRQASVRKADAHLCTSHSAVPSVLTAPLDEQGSPDDWKMARSVEVWGTSLYPKHVGAKETRHAFFRAAMLTSTRSACDSVDAPYWLGELQAGHGYVGMFASHMTALDARMYTLQPLAHGAKGLCFYAWHPMSSGYESAGFGMANLDGTPSERALAAGALAQLISQDIALFATARVPKNQAAICWNIYANIMWQCMREPWHYIPSRSYIGAYKALYEHLIPADYVHPDEIAEGKLEGYKALFLPFAFMLPRKTAQAVAAFVDGGGSLLAEARTAWNDEWGYVGAAVPGFGLERVFGCREAGAEGVDDQTPVSIHIVQEHPALPGLHSGDVLQGARFKEVLELLSPAAQVVGVFEDGSPAIVVNRYGQGWAVFVGTMLSLGYYKFGNANAAKLIQGIADVAGIAPPVTVGSPEKPSMLEEITSQVGIGEARGLPGLDIEPRLLVGKDEQGQPYYIFFAFNHSIDKVQPEFGLALTPGTYRAIDLISSQAVATILQGERLTLTKELAPGEIWVVKLLS